MNPTDSTRSHAADLRADFAATAPIAIIGIGCMFPKAPELGSYWANILKRRDAIVDVPSSHWNPSDFFDPDPKTPDKVYAAKGGFLDPAPFPALEFGIAPQNIEATDTTQLLSLMVAKAALDDAGYSAGRDFDRSRVSVIMGVTGALELVIPLGARLGHPRWRQALKDAGVADDVAERVVESISDSYLGWQENSFPGLLGNVAAGRIANRLDLHGTNCVVDAACASSLAALHLAMLELQTGRADLALTGGVDTFNDIFMYMCFSKTPALSPGGHSRPFDQGADGTTLGEGVGILALKRLDDAQRDGDRIYAVIKGLGSSSDGKGNAVYAPMAEGQARALRQAYRWAGVGPETIELAEAHGTGTKVGDAVEVSALEKVYREADPNRTWCAVGSVKSQIGHTKAAAGAAGLIKAALALYEKVLPPTLKVEDPIENGIPGRSPFYVSIEPRPWLPRPEHPRRAAVSSFGFGGSNYHCVLEEADPVKSAIDWDGETQIFAFSAQGAAGLSAKLQTLPADGSDWSAVRKAAARSRAEFQAADSWRLTLAVERDQSDLPRLAATARTLVQGGKSGSAPEGIWLQVGTEPGRLAFLFPGQGAQHIGMARDLACRFPRMQQALADADQAVGAFANGDRLSDVIYPMPAFDDATRVRQDEALRATEAAQPAIGAISLGMLAILEDFGVKPDAVAGHSYGELTALCASGRFDARTLCELSKLRGRLMAEQGGASESGMLAVMAPLEDVAAALREERLDLVLANRNAPRQAVLSGRIGELDRAADIFRSRKVTAKPLTVAAAFHSKFVAEARSPFHQELTKRPFVSGRIPVYANTTARPYPDDADEARSLLAGQLAEPVEFVGMIENMRNEGIETFVEVGPDAKLTGLVDAILSGRGRGPNHAHAAFALDFSRGKRSGVFDLARALAQLAALGHQVELKRWDEPFASRTLAADAGPAAKATLTIPVGGANPKPKPKPQAQAPVAPKPLASASVSASAPILKPAPQPVANPASIPIKPPVDSSKNEPMSANHHSGAVGVSVNGVNGDHSRLPRVSSAPTHPQPQPMAAPLAQAPAPMAVAPSATESLRVAHEGMMALQRLAEQTANLHRQFLEGQERAQRNFLAILEQQQRLLGVMPNLPQAHAPAPAPAPVFAPAPVTPAPAYHAPTPISVPMPSARSVVPPPSIPAPSRPTPTPAPASVPAAPTQATGQAQAVLLDVVAEKTGYPAEMLEPEMQLDADLGIDSIKRVEILSAVQERLPGAPEVKPEHLGSLRTLNDVIDFLTANAVAAPTGSASASAAAGSASKPNSAASSISSSSIQDALLRVVAEKTGYPAEMLEPDMQLDADLGIDSIKRVEILSAVQEQLPGAPEVKPEHLGSLRTLRDVIDFLSEGASQAVPPPPAAVAVTTPTSSNAAASASGLGPDRIRDALMTIVSEKTGYPAEMLEPEMQLDADLGIDSIKRVEILSAVQERLPGAPEVKPEHLGSLRTLNDVVAHLAAGAQRSEESPVPFDLGALPNPDPPAPSTISASRSLRIYKQVLSATSANEPIGERLDLGSSGEFWLAADLASLDLATATSSRLVELGANAKPMTIADALAAPIPERLAGLAIVAPTSTSDADAFLFSAFQLTRQLGPALRAAQGLLATASRLDGGFGLRSDAAPETPELGGLAGLSKTAGWEWSEVRCRAIDVDSAWVEAQEAGAALADELSRAKFATEVGLSRGERVELSLKPAPLPDGDGPPLLQKGDVVVVTGGARGVTAEAAVAMARRYGARLVLFGRSPAPTGEPDWLKGLADDAAIKRALIQQASGKASPRAVEEQVRGIQANREIIRTFQRIREAGGSAVYRSVDVRDPEATRQAIAAVREEFGPVRGLIHGAGVLADKLIAEKTDEQFLKVYQTKILGLRSMLDAIGPGELKALGLFSSSTGRFGRTGQVDYAVANEVLNKIAQRERRRRGGCRVVSVNWGPWDGGMVTSSLKTLFAKEGIGLIPLADGAEYLVRELQQSGGERPVEVVILGGEGATTPPKPSSVSEASPAADSGAVDPAVGSESAQRGPRPIEFGSPDLKSVFQRDVSLKTVPVLHSHVVDHSAVFPLVLMLEWMGHAALHGNPGLQFHGVDDLRVLTGVKIAAQGAQSLKATAGKAVRDGGVYVVPVELIGVDEICHARASVILTDRLPKAPEPAPDWPMGPRHEMDHRRIYEDVLFHGRDFQGIERIEGCDEKGIVGAAAAAPKPSQWLDQPPRSSWLADPLALDCALQLMILWTNRQYGRGSLPTCLLRYRQYRRSFPDHGVRIAARVTQPGSRRTFADIDLIDKAGGLVARIEGHESVLNDSLKKAFRRNALSRR